MNSLKKLLIPCAVISGIVVVLSIALADSHLMAQQQLNSVELGMRLTHLFG